MIDIGKSYKAATPAMSVPFDEEMDGRLKRTDKLDMIVMNEAEGNALLDIMGTMTMRGAEALEKPALKEFELIFSEGEQSGEKTTVQFRKTAFMEALSRTEEQGDIRIEWTPCIDAYVSFLDPSKTDFLIVFFSVHFFNEDGEEIGTATGNQTIFRSDDPRLTNASEDEQWFEDAFIALRRVYVAVQETMINRPEVFYCSHRRTHTTHSGKKGKRRKKVRVIRRICINRNELTKYASSGKHMMCACWGVTGHWRTYKNGKKIWIEPYRKGRERDNQDAYTSKEYVLEERK